MRLLSSAALLTCGLFGVFFVACSSSDSGAGSSGGSSSGSSGSVDEDGGSSGNVPSPPSTPSGGCGAPAAGQTGVLGSQSIKVGTSNRTYELTIPASYDGNKTFPLVLGFHGDGGDGGGIRGSLGLETASSSGAIFAYPDGEGATWQIDDNAAMQADIDFIDAMIGELQKKYCIDKAKTFVAGFSKGAYFVNQFACRTKSTLKGIATNAGGGPFDIDDKLGYDSSGNLKCTAPPVPAMQFQGDADNSVPLDEGMKARDHWKGVNGCTNQTTAKDPSPCVSYNGCTRPELWCQIPGMGHQIWTSSPAATWAFFSSL